METLLIWVGLFAATALTDWLSAKWVDSTNRINRAHISAVHEGIGLIAGFSIYTWTHDFWMIVPCVIGSWFGSYWAGAEEPLDPAFVQAVHDAIEMVNEKAASESKAP